MSIPGDLSREEREALAAFLSASLRRGEAISDLVEHGTGFDAGCKETAVALIISGALTLSGLYTLGGRSRENFMDVMAFISTWIWDSTQDAAEDLRGLNR